MDQDLYENEIADRTLRKQAIADRWNAHGGFLTAVDDDPHTQIDLALLLETQRAANAKHDEEMTTCGGGASDFSRISIPLLGRVWQGLIARQIASVQPLFDSEDCFYSLERDGNRTYLEKHEAKATAWRTKAVWSFEAAQDLRSYNNIDAEAELTAVLAQELHLELDRRMLTTMRNGAKTVRTWDYNTSLGDTIREKFEALFIHLLGTADMVEQASGRGKGNWIVTSPEVASIFETACTGFYPTTSDYFTSSLGVQYVGQVCGQRFKLYKDPLFPTSQIVMGYKGNHPYDCGFFYCPRLFLQTTATVLDPNSFAPRRHLLTEDVQRLVDPAAFARINIANFVI